MQSYNIGVVITITRTFAPELDILVSGRYHEGRLPSYFAEGYGPWVEVDRAAYVEKGAGPYRHGDLILLTEEEQHEAKENLLAVGGYDESTGD